MSVAVPNSATFTPSSLNIAMSTTFNKRFWSLEESCQLIEHYKNAPHLWNPNHADYKNRNKRRKSLEEFGIVLKVSPEEVERKIKIICSQYRRERRNYIKHEKSGVSSEFQSRWFGYNLMSFLNEINDERRKRNNQCENSLDPLILGDEYNDEAVSDNNDNISAHASENGKYSDIKPVDDKPYFTDIVVIDNCEQSQSPSPKKRKIQKEFLLQEAFECLKESPRDEFAVFGEYVALKLRKLNTVAYLRAQNEINNILYRAEFDMFFQKQGV